MSEGENKTLADVGGPDRIEIVPGLVFEDKLRIKTQRRLEKHFKLPVFKIFPGKMRNPITKEIETWDGIDFNFLENSIPFITILAQQIDETITEAKVELIFEQDGNEKLIAENIAKYFKMLNKSDVPKNLQRPKTIQKK